MYAALAFSIGAIVGSFLNVVIHRYPLGESIVFPASHCPHCGTPIRPYDNIPILSYVWLRGRCRACRQPFSVRYPLVELANALFYLAVFQRTGVSLSFLPLAALVSMILVLIYIDAEIQILPDVITLPGIVTGIALAWTSSTEETDLFAVTSIGESIIGAIIGAVLLTTIMGAYWLIRRVEGMGWGDVKMIALIGATVGGSGLAAVLLIASIGGSLVGIPAAIRSRKGMQAALPFGVFLGLGTLVVIFFGRTLFSWWVSIAFA